ncbi:MAG: rubredoxin [Methanomicrobium sp.]|nr:rubredoxin [Methanomicrobium sp.]MDD4299077.1 rubredoxin [Methanomicrobium sp.]
MKVWKCEKCGYVYDSRVGDAGSGIPKGTEFENLPEDWRCPRCGVKKDKFVPIEIEG